MPITPFSFNPENGWRDTETIETKPANETRARQLLQMFPDQVKDYINGSIIPSIGNYKAAIAATANTALTIDQAGSFVQVKSTSPITVTVPDAKVCAGLRYTFWNNTTTVNILSASGGDFCGLDYATGALQPTLNLTDDMMVEIVSDGFNWIVAKNQHKTNIVINADTTVYDEQRDSWLNFTTSNAVNVTLPSAGRGGRVFYAFSKPTVTYKSPSGYFYGEYPSTINQNGGQSISNLDGIFMFVDDGWNWRVICLEAGAQYPIYNSNGLTSVGGYDISLSGRLHQWGSFITPSIAVNAFWSMEFAYPKRFPRDCHAVVGTIMPLGVWDWQKGGVILGGDRTGSMHVAITNGGTAQTFQVNWMADGE